MCTETTAVNFSRRLRTTVGQMIPPSGRCFPVSQKALTFIVTRPRTCDFSRLATMRISPGGVVTGTCPARGPAASHLAGFTVKWKVVREARTPITRALEQRSSEQQTAPHSRCDARAGKRILDNRHERLRRVVVRAVFHGSPLRRAHAHLHCIVPIVQERSPMEILEKQYRESTR